MTGKRFIETISTGIVTDNQTGKEYNCEMRIDEDFLNLVNIIANENEQFKRQIFSLKLELDTHKHPLWSTREAERIVNELKEENGQLKSTLKELREIGDYQYSRINELSEENEELKQAIAGTEKMVQSTYDELTKLRCIKKNLGRIKSQWDWIMEAIQYD